MDRSAVIRSMERGHLRKVSDPYTPLKGLSKQTTNDLLFCCINVIYFVCWVLCSYKSKHRHTRKHTHTHTTQLGWILPQDGFTIALCQTWAGGGKRMFGVWNGYGTGMERGMERKA